MLERLLMVFVLTIRTPGTDIACFHFRNLLYLLAKIFADWLMVHQFNTSALLSFSFCCHIVMAEDILLPWVCAIPAQGWLPQCLGLTHIGMWSLGPALPRFCTPGKWAHSPEGCGWDKHTGRQSPPRSSGLFFGLGFPWIACFLPQRRGCSGSMWSQIGAACGW